MLEGAILFIAKIHSWDVSRVVYSKDFNKNCCHMRQNLPKFSRESMQLSSIVPLESHDFELNQEVNQELNQELKQYESPIITSAKQISPLAAEPLSINPLRYSPPVQLVNAADTLIHAAVQSPEVEYVGVRRPLQSTVQSPEVEYLGVRRPVDRPHQSPEVEYLGTKPPKWSNFFKGGTRKKNKMKKKKSNKNKMKRYVL